MSVTVKAGITEETIRKLMESLSQEDLKSVPPEIIHRGVMEELSKKTTREISVEVSKPGGEAAF